MTKYTKIWVNGTQKVLRQSYSLDRFDKRAVKNLKHTENFTPSVVFSSQGGAAQGWLQTLTVSSKTVPTGHEKVYFLKWPVHVFTKQF